VGYVHVLPFIILILEKDLYKGFGLCAVAVSESEPPDHLDQTIQILRSILIIKYDLKIWAV
jgi:hypothetical protein